MVSLSCFGFHVSLLPSNPHWRSAAVAVLAFHAHFGSHSPQSPWSSLYSPWPHEFEALNGISLKKKVVGLMIDHVCILPSAWNTTISYSLRSWKRYGVLISFGIKENFSTVVQATRHAGAWRHAKKKRQSHISHPCLFWRNPFQIAWYCWCFRNPAGAHQLRDR